jgi:hypothetical protein
MPGEPGHTAAGQLAAEDVPLLEMGLAGDVAEEVLHPGRFVVGQRLCSGRRDD